MIAETPSSRLCRDVDLVSVSRYLERVHLEASPLAQASTIQNAVHAFLQVRLACSGAVHPPWGHHSACILLFGLPQALHDVFKHS